MSYISRAEVWFIDALVEGDLLSADSSQSQRRVRGGRLSSVTSCALNRCMLARWVTVAAPWWVTAIPEIRKTSAMVVAARLIFMTRRFSYGGVVRRSRRPKVSRQLEDPAEPAATRDRPEGRSPNVSHGDRRRHRAASMIDNRSARGSHQPQRRQLPPRRPRPRPHPGDHHPQLKQQSQRIAGPIFSRRSRGQSQVGG